MELSCTCSHPNSPLPCGYCKDLTEPDVWYRDAFGDSALNRRMGRQEDNLCQCKDDLLCYNCVNDLIQCKIKEYEEQKRAKSRVITINEGSFFIGIDRKCKCNKMEICLNCINHFTVDELRDMVYHLQIRKEEQSKMLMERQNQVHKLWTENEDLCEQIRERDRQINLIRQELSVNDEDFGNLEI